MRKENGEWYLSVTEEDLHFITKKSFSSKIIERYYLAWSSSDCLWDMGSVKDDDVRYAKLFYTLDTQWTIV